MKRICAISLVLVFLLAGCTSPAKVTPTTYSREVIRDLVYAEIPEVAPNLTSLDIYTPKSGQNHPIVVYFHGGAWKSGDKQNVGYKPEAFTNEGYVFISANYRLSPEVQHPAHVQDVAKTIAWVYRNAANYQGDPNCIFLMGHSAGAHLVALVATDEKYLEAEGLTPNILRGVILLDGGGYDIPRLIEANPRLYTRYYEVPFSEDPLVWEDASPIKHIAEGKGIPPFLIIHKGEGKLSRLPAQWIFEALQKAGIYAEVYYTTGKTHMTLDGDIGKPGDEATKQILDFLDICP